MATETYYERDYEWPRKKSTISNRQVGAFGCSHTWGVSVNYNEAWPWLLNANNFGLAGGSTDFISRNLAQVIDNFSLKKIYILYPAHTRFEYIKDGKIYQSLPTDCNRYKFREQNSEDWLVNNHRKNKEYIKKVCLEKQVELLDFEFEYFHQYIDYPDKWPLAKDNMHYNHQWHQWVAEILIQYEKTRHQT